MNGLGGNTCIQDAFNLAWKLAAVLRWGAGSGLLDTYDAERRPVGGHVVDRALAGWHQNPDVVRSLGIDPEAAPEKRERQFSVLFEDSDAGEERRAAFEVAKRSKVWSYHAHGTEMNQVYSSTAVLNEGAPPIEYARDPELFYQPSSQPGSRVPHAWVAYRGRTISTLDLCGPEQFTLLTRARGGAWLKAAERAARELGVPLAAFSIGPGADAADLYGSWPEASEIGESGCLLVRPDHCVAWRRFQVSDDPAGSLIAALQSCLSLAPMRSLATATASQEGRG